MDALVSGGTVVTAEGTRRVDVLVRGEKIHSVGTGLSAGGARVIDAEGMYVVPGGVDAHTHLDLESGTERSSDDWYTGTVAAACGGTTTVIDHPAFGPPGCSVFHQITKYRAMADGTAAVDYGLHGVIQHVNDDVIRDLEALLRGGVPSIKLYLTYGFRLSDDEVLRVLERERRLGGLAAVHCENHGIVTYLRDRFEREHRGEPRFHPLSRPPEAEAEAVSRLIRLAETAGALPVEGQAGASIPSIYIVHLSTAAGLEEVRRGRARGVPVFAETCPQYLLLTDEKYLEPGLEGLKYVMSPPLRKEADREALWEGVRDGTIQVVATDHCPFLFSRKKELAADSFTLCPNGIPGIETRMALLFSEGVMKNRISLERFTDATSTAPARIMGLYPRKGALLPGSDADIVLLDPGKKVRLAFTSLHQRVDYTPFEGLETTGYPILTMLRGKLIMENGRFLGAKGDGKFLERSLPLRRP